MNNPLIGRGWVFPLTLDQRGTFALTSDHDELAQAIQIILSTAPGQRVMRPDFGCRIHELVFAPNDGATAGLAINYVTDALGQWEPRITLTNVEADPDPENANVLQITVNYQVAVTHSNRTLVFPFYLIPEEAANGTSNS